MTPRYLFPAACLAVLLAGCGRSGPLGAGHPCTEMDARHGIGVRIDSPLAASVAAATVSVCWGGVCHSPELTLLPLTSTSGEPCQDGVCSATTARTDGTTGFLDLPDLPASQVRLTVDIVDAAGGRLAHERIDLTPTLVHPNGPECPAAGPQATVTVTPEGHLRAG